MTTTATTNTTDLTTLNAPELGQTARNELLEALEAALAGSKVTIAVRYTKQTNAKARIAGKDYKKVLSLTPDIIEGTVAKVAQNKKGGWYILLDATTTRQPIDENGEIVKKVGWTSIKPEGITALIGTEVK